jgi:peptidase, M16 family
LNNILGGPGMSARLNLALRERRGLVYTVESTMVSYSSTGLWSVYFGCDAQDVDECMALVRAELDHFIENPLTDSELTIAKQQIKGQIGIACDNRENLALDFGKGFLHYGWKKDITALYRNIDAITAEDIQAVAQELFVEEQLTKLIYE